MKFLLISLLVPLAYCCFVAGNEIKDDKANEQDFEELGLHYGKYLKEVVAALDKDQKFTETIKNMDSKDIESGKVAEQLKHVHEDVRQKLNELKYLEIKRLRDLATRKNEIEQYGETYHGNDKRKWRTLGSSLGALPDHLGSDGTYFDVHDLHKLMVTATNDLEKLDKERREDFKTYEMEKQWQFDERLKMMNETEKQEAIKLRQKLKEKHESHAPLHEPGTRQQFEEVWEKKDNLPKNEFDPKTFFALHDTNSDNYWDQQEVRQLLATEIQKLYESKNPEDDPNEMEEEYERMREHVYKEIDADRDGLISIKEFLDYSKKPEFQRDNGWEDVTKKEAYSKQEYENYLRNRDASLRSMHGHYDPAYYANQPQNLHLPNWGLGMPAGVNPAQYYGYHPADHPAVQQQMYHQAAAYQQAAAAGYQQPAVVPQHGYQQPQQQVPQHQAGQPYYQAPPAIQGQQQLQQPQQQAPPQQAGQQYYQAPQANQGQQAAPAQVNSQQAPQQPPPQAGQAPQAPIQGQQQPPQQVNYQQPPQQQVNYQQPQQQAPPSQAHH